MKKILSYITSWFAGLFRVWRREFSLVFKDVGVMLFFFGLPTIYPVVYALIYNPELIKDVGVVVVDNSRTAASRELVRHADATEPVGIVGYAANMGEARRALNRKDCYAIMEIPADYDRRLGRGEQANVNFYCDMSLLLRFRQFTSAMTDLQLDAATRFSHRTLDEAGLAGQTLAAHLAPVQTSQQFMGDPTQGFASFIMPGILVLIIQQSIVLGSSMVLGGSGERRRRLGGRDPMWVDAPASAVPLGKALCYLAIYIPLLIYTLHIVPWMFKFPHYGSLWDEMLLMLPLVLASAMFGQTLGVFVTERESSLLVIVFTSVIFLFLSGLTWPRYAMTGFWRLCSDLVPATWGVDGFVRINSDGGTLGQQGTAYSMLWGLAGLYWITASLAAAWWNRINRASRQVVLPPAAATIP